MKDLPTYVKLNVRVTSYNHYEGLLVQGTSEAAYPRPLSPLESLWQIPPAKDARIRDAAEENRVFPKPILVCRLGKSIAVYKTR